VGRLAGYIGRARHVIGTAVRDPQQTSVHPLSSRVLVARKLGLRFASSISSHMRHAEENAGDGVPFQGEIGRKYFKSGGTWPFLTGIR
jgi:hypothetical protein